jgi:hypothetical protein
VTISQKKFIYSCPLHVSEDIGMRLPEGGNLVAEKEDDGRRLSWRVTKKAKKEHQKCKLNAREGKRGYYATELKF